MRVLLLAAALVLALGHTSAMASKPRPVPKTVLDSLKSEPKTVPEFDTSSVLNGSMTTEFSDGTWGVETWKQQKRSAPQMRRGLRGRP